MPPIRHRYDLRARLGPEEIEKRSVSCLPSKCHILRNEAPPQTTKKPDLRNSQEPNACRRDAPSLRSPFSDPQHDRPEPKHQTRVNNGGPPGSIDTEFPNQYDRDSRSNQKSC